MHSAADTVNFNFGGNYQSLLKNQPENSVAWIKALMEGSVTPNVPVAPVIVYFGSKDVTIDPVMGKLYREQMCSLGGNVARVQLPGEQNHFTTPGASQPLYVEWIKDRFAGKPVGDGCAEGTQQP